METAMHHRSKPAAMHWALFKKIFASETSVSVQLFKKGLRPPQSSVTHWNGLKLHIDQAPLQICKFALGVTSSLKHPDASLLHGAFSSATGSILHQPLQHAQLQGLYLSIKIPHMALLHFLLEKFIKNQACLTKPGIFHWDWEPWPSVQTHGYFIQNWHVIDRHHFTNHLFAKLLLSTLVSRFGPQGKNLASNLILQSQCRIGSICFVWGQSCPKRVGDRSSQVLLQEHFCTANPPARRCECQEFLQKKRERLIIFRHLLNHAQSFIRRRCNHLIQNLSALLIFPQHNLHNDTFCLLAFHSAKRRGVCAATNPYTILLEPRNLCKCVKSVCNIICRSPCTVTWWNPCCGGSP